MSLKGKLLSIVCLTFIKNGCCILKDDIAEIMDKVKEAEVIV